MPATLSLLVYRRSHKSAMFMRKTFTALVAGVFCGCLCGSRASAASSTDLDSTTVELGNIVDKTTLDVENAFQELQDETNLSSGTLIVGGIIQAHPGDTIQWPITLVPGDFFPTALQSDLLIPTGLTFVSAAIGPAATQAGKQLSVSPSNAKPTVLVAGLNQAPIDRGVIVIVTLKVDPAAVKRQYSVVLENPAVSDGNGEAIISSAVSGTVVVN